jgi:fatty acid desaturase
MVIKDAAVGTGGKKPRTPGAYSQPASRTVEPFVDPATNPAVIKQQDYAELKRRIVAAGLLDKQPGYFAFNSILRLTLLGASIAVLFLVNNLWVQLGNAVFMAFAMTQIGYLGHDAGHRQIFRGAHRNDVFGLGINALLGLGRTWWVDTHNEHHVDPNDLERDPHTLLPIFAFSDEQARGKEGFLRRLVGYQGFYFYPVLLFESVGARLATVMFLMNREMKGKVWESLAMVLHFTVYFGLVFYALSWTNALLFVAVHQGLQGLYMGSVFAPNHKGMPTFTREDNIDFFRRQVLTSRNVVSNPVADFWYGGLNYQIEHHLFPSMARNKLKEAKPIVMAFCEERSVPYAESGALRSNVEILQFLHGVSAPLREDPQGVKA